MVQLLENMRLCRWCGKSIEHRSGQARFCDKRCLDRERRPPEPWSGVCLSCGSCLIGVKARGSKWCSSKCRGRVRAIIEGDKRRAQRIVQRLRRPEHFRDYNRLLYAKSENHRVQSIVRAKNRRDRLRGAIGSYTTDEWRSIVSKQNSRCANCRLKCELTVDHIVPISRGGSNYILNIQGLCGPCNSRKRDNEIPGTQRSIFDRIPGGSPCLSPPVSQTFSLTNSR